MSSSSGSNSRGQPNTGHNQNQAFTYQKYGIITWFLITSCSKFNFNDATDNIPYSNSTLVDNQSNELSPIVSLSTDRTSFSLPSNTDIDMSASYNNNNILHRSFKPNYNGPIIILAESLDQNKNMGSWHPISVAKFFSTNFAGITNIKSSGPKKVKITFNTVINSNNCLNFDIPRATSFQVNIPIKGSGR